jgi:hypothetical protein
MVRFQFPFRNTDHKNLQEIWYKAHYMQVEKIKGLLLGKKLKCAENLQEIWYNSHNILVEKVRSATR